MKQGPDNNDGHSTKGLKRSDFTMFDSRLIAIVGELGILGSDRLIGGWKLSVWVTECQLKAGQNESW